MQRLPQRPYLGHYALCYRREIVAQRPGKHAEIPRPQRLHDRSDGRVTIPWTFVVRPVDPGGLRTHGRSCYYQAVRRWRRKGTQDLADTLPERRAASQAERYVRADSQAHVTHLRFAQTQPEELVQANQSGRRVCRTTPKSGPGRYLLCEAHPYGQRMPHPFAQPAPGFVDGILFRRPDLYALRFDDNLKAPLRAFDLYHVGQGDTLHDGRDLVVPVGPEPPHLERVIDLRKSLQPYSHHYVSPERTRESATKSWGASS